ncbi:hypothetical protein LTR27_000895 [Elasticomyces elasticus]|nr:hypothetical protein LTR27_000895 [Elasticomyces elasticus]
MKVPISLALVALATLSAAAPPHHIKKRVPCLKEDEVIIWDSLVGEPLRYCEPGEDRGCIGTELVLVTDLPECDFGSAMVAKRETNDEE